MKIALLQFAPDVGTVQANIKKADDLLQRSKLPVDLDWLILPEMAFSGKPCSPSSVSCCIVHEPISHGPHRQAATFVIVA